MADSRKYTDLDVQRALEDIQNGASISESARKFGIPRSTLSEKRSGRLPIEYRMGPPTVLTTEEESLLAKWIFHVGQAGFPVSKDQLLDSVQMLLNESKRETIFTDNRPGRKWYEAFTRRHPLVAERECQNLTAARASVTEEGLRAWFKEVYRYLENTKNVDVLNDPNRIFNMDESGFFLNPKPGKVLARKGQKRVYMKIQGDEKEMITVLMGGNASGVKTPPLVMFPYQRLPSNIVKDMPEGWAFGRSPNGWMTAESFYEYITNCFHPWLIKNNIKLPIALFVDGHSSHITYHLSEFCREKGIILIALHPNATHLMQPMDVSVFRSLKGHWHKAAIDYPRKNNSARITRDKFSKVLHEVLNNDITESIVANGFTRCGIYPFNADAIDYEQLIKRQKLNEIGDSSVENHVAERQSSQFLDEFECKLDADTLQSFKNSSNEWSGRCEDTSLFQFWTKIGGRTAAKNHGEPTQNNLALISENDIEIEYIDTTYEDCLENGQIIEIIGLSGDEVCVTSTAAYNGSESGNVADVRTSSCTSEPTQHVPDNDELDADEFQLYDEGSAVSFNDSDDSNGDVSLMDDEITADLVDAYVPKHNDSHIPDGFPKHFKDAMFWPGRPSCNVSESRPKRKPKERVPAVLVSDDFIEYLKNKENEKLRLEAEKVERQKQREVRKAEKQKLEEEKAKAMLERKSENQRKKEEKEKATLERKLEKQKKEAEKEKQKTERRMEVESRKIKKAKKSDETKNDDEKKTDRIQRKRKIVPK